MKTTFYNLLILALLFPLSLQAQQEKTDSLYNRSLELISAFQFEKAVKILSALYIKDEYNIDYLQKLGYCNFQLGRYRDAKIFYNEVLKLDSTNASDVEIIDQLSTLYLKADQLEFA